MNTEHKTRQSDDQLVKVAGRAQFRPNRVRLSAWSGGRLPLTSRSDGRRQQRRSPSQLCGHLPSSPRPRAMQVAPRRRAGGAERPRDHPWHLVQWSSGVGGRRRRLFWQQGQLLTLVGGRETVITLHSDIAWCVIHNHMPLNTSSDIQQHDSANVLWQKSAPTDFIYIRLYPRIKYLDEDFIKDRIPSSGQKHGISNVFRQWKFELKINSPIHKLWAWKCQYM